MASNHHDQIKLLDQNDKLTAATLRRRAEIGFVAGFQIPTPPEISISLIGDIVAAAENVIITILENPAGGFANIRFWNQLLAVPFSFVHGQNADLGHRARCETRFPPCRWQTVRALKPAVSRYAHFAEDFVFDKIFGSARHDGVNDLHLSLIHI